MATYNGAKYIKAQVDSIMKQLGPQDELVVCDDQSSDETVAILKDYGDSRIRVFCNETRLGYVKNFERALNLARGDYIFLSDQDDIWISDRIVMMMNGLNSKEKAWLVSSNFDLIDDAGAGAGEFRLLGPVRRFRWQQVLAIFMGKAPYFGCTFLLRREALEYFLPIPQRVESHDIWFALVASVAGRIVNMSESTLLHRIHDGNVTTRRRRSLLIVFRSRLIFAKALASRIKFMTIKNERVS